MKPGDGEHVLAFLQNQWDRNPVLIQGLYDRRPDGRRFLFRYILMHSFTGRRIKEAFGDLVDRMVFENASPRIGDHSRSAFPADLEWMRLAISEVGPRAVLAFGQTAAAACRGLCGPATLVTAPHPAARGASVMGELREAGAKLAALLARAA